MAKGRIQTTKQMAANDRKVTISNLSEVFQVTEGAVRRDLEKLKGEGFLTGTYGGAALNTAVLTESIHFYKYVSSFYEGKQLTAHKALPSIDNKTTITVDSGNIIMESLKSSQDRSGLTLLTSPTEAIHVLAQSEIKAVSTGGELNKNTLSL